MTPFSVVVALDQKYGIGKNGALPWQLSGDLKHFKQLTSHTFSDSKRNAVIMGRRTWESIPKQFRPLPKRINIVLTKGKSSELSQDKKNILVINDFDQAFDLVQSDPMKEKIESVFVIGGQQIFELAVTHPLCQKIFVTHILQTFSCDTYFPRFQNQFREINRSAIMEEKGVRYYFAEYHKKETR